MSDSFSHEKLLDRIANNFSDYLIFAGILDNKAKLLNYRKGKASFALPSDRYDTLDVQISLMFALIRQLEDIAGNHRFTVCRFARYDVFLLGISDLHLFVIVSPGSGEEIAKSIIETMDPSSGQLPTLAPRIAEQSMPRSQDFGKGKKQVALLRKPRPEAIIMLKGYLKGIEAGYAIEEGGDDEGGYIIKPSEGEKLAWNTLEKLNSVFGDQIIIHYVDTDSRDGRIYAKISTKDNAGNSNL